MSCSSYMIPYEVGAQELQVLRTASDSSLQICYLEGRYLVFVSVRLMHLVPQFSHSKGDILCRSGSWTGGDGGWVELSGKMQVLARLLHQLRQRTNDRIVLVSNYTQVYGNKKGYVFKRLEWFEICTHVR